MSITYQHRILLWSQSALPGSSILSKLYNDNPTILIWDEMKWWLLNNFDVDMYETDFKSGNHVYLSFTSDEEYVRFTLTCM